jgi:hypothetical protein
MSSVSGQLWGRGGGDIGGNHPSLIFHLRGNGRHGLSWKTMGAKITHSWPATVKATVCVCAYVCACARALARARVCVCVCVQGLNGAISMYMLF